MAIEVQGDARGRVEAGDLGAALTGCSGWPEVRAARSTIRHVAAAAASSCLEQPAPAGVHDLRDVDLDFTAFVNYEASRLTGVRGYDRAEEILGQLPTSTMATDPKWPGPYGSYPYWPRDKDGYPIRQGSLHHKRTADGRTVLIDTTACTDHRRLIHVVAPRLVRPAPTGGVEDITAATLEGQTVCICRNIETGEQVEW